MVLHKSVSPFQTTKEIISHEISIIILPYKFSVDLYFRFINEHDFKISTSFMRK